MMLSGVLLWLNAVACREELFRAWVAACEALQRSLNSAGMASAGQHLAFCMFTLLAASPAWKLLLGTLLLQLSVAPTPPASVVAYPPTRSI